jgi:hypothetical protein
LLKKMLAGKAALLFRRPKLRAPKSDNRRRRNPGVEDAFKRRWYGSPELLSNDRFAAETIHLTRRSELGIESFGHSVGLYHAFVCFVPHHLLRLARFSLVGLR